MVELHAVVPRCHAAERIDAIDLAPRLANATSHLDLVPRGGDARRGEDLGDRRLVVVLLGKVAEAYHARFVANLLGAVVRQRLGDVVDGERVVQEEARVVDALDDALDLEERGRRDGGSESETEQHAVRVLRARRHPEVARRLEPLLRDRDIKVHCDGTVAMLAVLDEGVIDGSRSTIVLVAAQTGNIRTHRFYVSRRTT